MSYNIKNFAQTVTYTVNDSTANTNAVSLTLLGKSLPNYGTYFNQNFVWLMENFSSDSANPPPYAVQGQLWWDNTYKYLNVYDGSAWQTVYGNLSTLYVNGAITTSSLSAITVNASNIGNASAKLYGGNIAITGNALIQGGLSLNTNATIVTNQTTASVFNTTATTLNLGGAATTVSIGAVTGTTTVNNDLKADNFYATGGGQVVGYHTGAIGANTPNSVVATSVTTSNGGQVIGYLTGAIGANTANTGSFTTITSTSHVTPTANNTANVGALSTLYANVFGTNYYVANSIIPIANTTADIGSAERYFEKAYVINHIVANSIIPTSNTTVDIGSAQATFENIYSVNFFGTSTTAKYADLAEKYLPDSIYDVGTVMMIGGNAEITQHDGSKVRAIGVISEHPAYKMNSDQEGGVYVALKGRVPVKVIGPVLKGQSLIGTAHGLAVAQTDDSQWMFAISLESHKDSTIKLIEAVIL